MSDGLTNNVVLADHERRISLLERTDSWAIRCLLTLGGLRFLGFDNLDGIMIFFRHIIGAK